jgi:hypothetical protein
MCGIFKDVYAAVAAAAGVLSLLELLQHLSDPDCEGAVLLMPSVRGAPAGSQQQQQQQGLLGAVLGLLHERHIAALQVRLPAVCSTSVCCMHCACFAVKYRRKSCSASAEW